MDFIFTHPNDEGQVYFQNVDMGGSTSTWHKSTPNNDPDRVEVGSTIVIHLTGGMYWAGRGQQKYAGAEFRVFTVKEIKHTIPTTMFPEGQKYFVCEQVVQFTIRKEK